MGFSEPHASPERGSPTRLSVLGQRSYKGLMVQKLKYLYTNYNNDEGIIITTFWMFSVASFKRM